MFGCFIPFCLYTLPQIVLCDLSDNKGSISLSHDITTTKWICVSVLSFTRLRFCRSLCAFLSIQQYWIQITLFKSRWNWRVWMQQLLKNPKQCEEKQIYRHGYRTSEREKVKQIVACHTRHLLFNQMSLFNQVSLYFVNHIWFTTFKSSTFFCCCIDLVSNCLSEALHTIITKNSGRFCFRTKPHCPKFKTSEIHHDITFSLSRTDFLFWSEF